MELMNAIDAWANPNIPPPPGEASGFRRIEYLFTGNADLRQRGTTSEQYIEEMDASAIEKAVLTASQEGVNNDWVFEMLDKHPDRFALALYLDPTRGMETIRFLEQVHSERPVRLVRLLAFKTQLPYNHAVYYGLYAKCIELDIPIGVNVGIPGPPVPGQSQHPMALDEVCHFFPELKVIFAHGGEPWDALCVKLMLKWKNLHYMTSAFSPKHIPNSVIHYLNTRGPDKVMFASDYPILSWDRCRREIEEIEFRDEETKRKFLHDNAARIFFPTDA